MVYMLVAVCIGSLLTLSFLVYDLYVQKSNIRCSILELRNRMESLETFFSAFESKPLETVEAPAQKKKHVKRKKT